MWKDSPYYISTVQFSHSVVSDSLRPHEPQHTRPPCPSPTPRVYPDSCPLSRWCHPTISSLSFPSPPAFNLSQHQGLFHESALLFRWPKYCSFSFNISSSNELSGLISFRIDWLDLFAVQGTLRRLLQHHSSKASILWPSAIFAVQLTFIHDYWKKKNTFLFSKARICRKWKSSAKSSFPTMYFLDRRSEGAHLYGCRNLCVLHFYNFLL